MGINWNKYHLSRQGLALASLGLVLSLFIFFKMNAIYNEKLDLSFEKQIEKGALLFEQKVRINKSILEGVASFYNASKFVDRDEFRQFTSKILEKNHFLQAVEWVPVIEHTERTKYRQMALKDGLRDFKIKVKSSSGELIESPKKEVYYPVFYLEPIKGNEKVLGFDLGSNRKRLRALNKAKESGNAVATEKINLVQAGKSTPGMLIIYPVYKKDKKQKILGYVLVVYKIQKLINRIIIPGLNSNIGIQIFDLENESENLIYAKKIKGETSREHIEDINIYERTWRIKWQLIEESVFQSEKYLPYIISVAVLMIFFLAVALIEFYSQKSRLVEEEVREGKAELSKSYELLEKTTDEVQRSQHLLKQIVDSSDSSIYVKSIDGRYILV
jgi:CHASE1-domain containing sensor protein